MAQVTKRKTADGEYRYDVRTRIGGRVVTRTFKRRKDADAYAATVEADKLRGVAVDPRQGRITVSDFGREWVRQRTGLSQRTRELYSWLFERYVVPAFGEVPIGKVTPAGVRRWNAELASERTTMAAKAYRLLSTIMRTAVADEVIVRNPCQVKGAATEKSPERPVATVAEVAALADAMPEHLRLLVLLACWCQLRRGELLGLRRRDVDLLHRTITIEQSRTIAMSGEWITKAPKTEAGRRSLSVPANVAHELEHHLDAFVGASPDSLLFMGEKGGPLGIVVLEKAWRTARASIGRPELRLHDLRHTGLTLAAATGATVKELMRRAGHASPAAALRYQHATEERDKVLAEALAQLAGSGCPTMCVDCPSRAESTPEPSWRTGNSSSCLRWKVASTTETPAPLSQMRKTALPPLRK